MISAANATILSDLVASGGTPVTPPSTARQGNELIDELNLAVVFAAMKGLKTCYLAIGKYPRQTINNTVDTLEGLGYIVNRDRERAYGDLVLEWE